MSINGNYYNGKLMKYCKFEEVINIDMSNIFDNDNGNDNVILSNNNVNTK